MVLFICRLWVEGPNISPSPFSDSSLALVAIRLGMMALVLGIMALCTGLLLTVH